MFGLRVTIISMFESNSTTYTWSNESLLKPPKSRPYHDVSPVSFPKVQLLNLIDNTPYAGNSTAVVKSKVTDVVVLMTGLLNPIRKVLKPTESDEIIGVELIGHVSDVTVMVFLGSLRYEIVVLRPRLMELTEIVT